MLIPALLLASVLAGCAPPAVTVASLVVDGISYAATGKSSTDHAISAVVREDCALLRAAQGEAICDPDGEVLIEFGTVPSAYDRSDPGAYDRRGQAAGRGTNSARAREIASRRLTM